MLTTTFLKTVLVSFFIFRFLNFLIFKNIFSAIPAGILKPPFFDHKAPPAMNYGSIGSIIGHELTHCMTGGNVLVGTHDHFDNSWWSEESVVEFHSRARCFVEQYGEVLEEKLEVMLDGKQTLIENIADNAGLKDAYEAFQLNSRRNNDQLEGQILPGLNFTAEQLFFVSHAKVRVFYFTKKIDFNYFNF